MRAVQPCNGTTLSALLAAVLMGAVVTGAATPASAAQADRVEVAGAHALVSPMHEGGGVFMTLTNRGETDAVITSAEAPVAATVALHRCNRPGGMQSGRMQSGGMQSGRGGQRMQPPEPASGPLTIPAGGAVTLQRGGRHLCMSDTTERFKLGAEFPLTLRFQDGSSKTVPLKIEGVAKPRRQMMQTPN